MNITMDGKWQTRCGLPARVLCVDAVGQFPVVYLLGEYAYRTKINGKCSLSDDVEYAYDLVPAPEAVPLESKDVFFGCIARSKYWHNKDAWAPIYPNDQGNFCVGTTHGILPQVLMRDYEIKYPGKTIWEPCSKAKVN